MSVELEKNYETLVEGSIEFGVDGFGRYAGATFESDSTWLTVIHRETGYSISWDTEYDATHIFTKLNHYYPIRRDLYAFRNDGVDRVLEPDGVERYDFTEYVFVEAPFPDFVLEWQPVEYENPDNGEVEEFSGIEVTSNTEHFDIDRPVFRPAWELHRHLTEGVEEDESRSIMNDVRFFLEEPLR